MNEKVLRKGQRKQQHQQLKRSRQESLSEEVKSRLKRARSESECSALENSSSEKPSPLKLSAVEPSASTVSPGDTKSAKVSGNDSVEMVNLPEATSQREKKRVKNKRKKGGDSTKQPDALDKSITEDKPAPVLVDNSDKVGMDHKYTVPPVEQKHPLQRITRTAQERVNCCMVENPTFKVPYGLSYYGCKVTTVLPMSLHF